MILEQADRLAQPDGFIATLMALEGIADGATLLNGPTGCKFYLGEMSKDQYRRIRSFDLLRFAEEFYFMQDRVPCTYLDDYDYVFGASEKLEYVFGRVAAKHPAFIAVLNSPGASLIGDDLERYIRWAGLSVPWVALDVPAFSHPFGEGYAEGCLKALDALAPEAMPVLPHAVNLLGLSIWHRHWKGSLKSLTKLLSRCGIRVQAALGASASVAELRQVRAAALNVVVHSEGGVLLGRGMSERYGTPFFCSDAGAPLGFDATEAWLRGVCERLSVDPTPGVTAIAEERMKAAETLYRFHQKNGLPHGVSFGVALEPSLALPVTRFARDFLGMQPQAIQVPDEDCPEAKALLAYLKDAGCEDAWNAPLTPDDPPAAVFADDAILLRCNAKKKLAAPVDLAMPSKDRTNFLERAVLGVEGSVWLLQLLVDGLWRLVDVDG